MPRHRGPLDAPESQRSLLLFKTEVAKLADGRWIAGGADGTIYIGAVP